jgi:hypothetical protein
MPPTEQQEISSSRANSDLIGSHKPHDGLDGSGKRAFGVTT